MRAVGCIVHQALTPEAASIVKHAASLAQKRGHSQVTPLHVASSILSSPSGLLRAACLQSHSHPLQCKALELCFNVALNRLPATAASSGLILAYQQAPALSNALVAAFKRAQAHQRRGSIESQQQTLPTLKIELDQLIISILDDPSVSRVMREAGFSSTQVKCNVEQAISSDTYTPNAYPAQSIMSTVKREDVNSILDTLVDRKKRSIAVVGERLSDSESVVRVLMDMVNKGEVSESLMSLQFINIQLSTFDNMSAEEVQHKVGELRCLAKSCSLNQRGSVLYLGDLQKLSEYTSGSSEKKRGLFHPIETMLREIGNWVSGGSFEGETVNRDLWLLGIASYPTYMRCRVGNPSLDVLLGLHALTIPAGSLGFSLNFDRELYSHMRKRSDDGNCLSSLSDGGSPQKQTHPSTNANSNSHGSISYNLPSWLHVHIKEKRTQNNDQSLFPLKDQCGRMSSIEYAGNRLNLGRELHFMITGKNPSLICCSSSNPNLNSSSTSSSCAIELEYVPRFKELNAEKMKVLCSVLEKEVPWQKDIIPDIASIILQCRSGMMKRKERSPPPKMKEDTWLFFQGNDSQGKEKIARELAFTVFGSHTNLTSIRLGAFSMMRSKRLRSETSHSYIERFIEAISGNSHSVVMMEDIDQLDYYSQKSIKDAIERGKIVGANEEEVSTEDAIIILSCKSYESRTKACSPSAKQEGEEKEEDNGNFKSSVSLDLNLSAEDNMQHCDLRLVEIVDRNFVLKVHDDLKLLA